MAHSETHSQKDMPMPENLFKAKLDSIVNEMKTTAAWEPNVVDEFEAAKTPSRIHDI